MYMKVFQDMYPSVKYLDKEQYCTFDSRICKQFRIILFQLSTNQQYSNVSFERYQTKIFFRKSIKNYCNLHVRGRMSGVRTAAPDR